MALLKLSEVIHARLPSPVIGSSLPTYIVKCSSDHLLGRQFWPLVALPRYFRDAFHYAEVDSQRHPHWKRSTYRDSPTQHQINHIDRMCRWSQQSRNREDHINQMCHWRQHYSSNLQQQWSHCNGGNGIVSYLEAMLTWLGALWSQAIPFVGHAELDPLTYEGLSLMGFSVLLLKRKLNGF